jgi:hypothetical protein
VRGATGYFCNKGGLRKMAYPLNTRSRFDAKSQNTEKIKTRPNLESFLVSSETSFFCFAPRSLTAVSGLQTWQNSSAPHLALIVD